MKKVFLGLGMVVCFFVALPAQAVLFVAEVALYASPFNPNFFARWHVDKKR